MDTIASSVAMAHYLMLRDGINVDVCNLDDFNKETLFAFEYFGFDKNVFKKIDKVTKEDKVILVDHNEFSQSVNNIEEAKIVMVVDHHKIDNFKTSAPLEYIAKPVGSTATIIYGLLKEVKGLENKCINGLLLSAILSDTLLFNSPTCTELDKEVANDLAVMLDIDMEKYGLELLKAGADLNDVNCHKLIDIDCKLFEFNGYRVKINQINTADINDVLKRQEEIETEMKKCIEKENLNLYVIMITDIIKCDSEIIVLGKDSNLFEKAFDIQLENNRVFLENVVSRKKQIAPKLIEVSK